MRGYRIAAFALALFLVLGFLPRTAARAQENGKTVRVGWYESPFNARDEFGRRSGYAYDYQQKISAFTGWTYEYVTGSWPDLMQMLIEGRIDLLSDVSYTEERTKSMLFSSFPMGSEEYYLFIAPTNEEITAADYATFNGKKIGVNKGSVQVGFFREWAEANGVQAELVEMTETVDEALTMLRRGAIDMYIALDAYLSIDTAVPVCKIGSSDFYFAVSLSHPELLPELNNAMQRIRDEDPYYTQQLEAKYIKTSGVNLYLSADEKAWLNDHGIIRVGYQDNYLAFCAKDPKTGELTGALKEYLRIASDCLENAHIDFEAICYPTAAAALEAVKTGEVDCAFPANLTNYDGETQGFYMTPPLMRTDISAIIRAADRSSFSQKDRVTVAVNAGNTNYDMFLLDHFPEWRSVYFKDTPEGLQAISEGKVDCLLISNYRFNNISALCQKYQLTTLSTGVEMDYCFAVDRKSTTLYSILSKVTDLVPATSVNAALSFYFTEDARYGIGDIIRLNAAAISCLLGAVILLLLFLLLRSIRSEKKAKTRQQLISATEIDTMTGLYNKNFFYEYVHRMNRDYPDKQMDAVVLNIEQFHAVNAINGRSFGDQVICGLGDAIHDYLIEKEGIACHSEGDRFAMYCAHMEDCHELFDRLQNKLNKLSPHSMIQLRMGVMPWQKGIDPRQQIEQALIACNLARGYFKEHLVVFDDKAREREAFEQRLLGDVHRAVENREFEVHYQPKYDIQSDPPKLKSAEALVRWRHPELGMIPPGEFIPLFEQNGQINIVDKYVWAEAARQIAAWREKYGVTVPVSVNLSRMDVFDPALEKTLDALQKENGLQHGDLKLEVTESACTENPYKVIDVIERLRKKGFEIEMDDFGSGYSSLNMLSAMPIDVLKMDRAFVVNIEHSAKDIQLVDLILGIARNLKIPVIAEGVETDAQLRILKDMGCPLMQGFIFSRPLPAADFEAAVIEKAVSAR